MMIGCGYCVKTVRRRRYLYFWHYEDREDRLRIFQDRRGVLVPRTQVGQHEEAYPGFLRGLRGLTRGRVSVAVRLLLERRIRRRVMDQEVRVARHLDERLVGHRVARVHDLATATRRTQHVFGADRPTA